MARAFILLETSAGSARIVAEAIEGLAGVDSADVVTGPFDVIVHLGGEVGAIGDMVTEQIHQIGGVVRSTTCFAVDNGKVLATR